MFALYPFQLRMRRELYAAIREKKSTVGPRQAIGMFSATGTGKTTVTGQIIADVLKKRARSLFVVDRLELCEQTADVFRDRFGFPSSVWQGQHPDYRTDAPVQVAMWQTLQNRRDELMAWVASSPADLLVWWDEGHETAWTGFAKWFLAETALLPNVYHVVLTATPERLKPTEGMGDICDTMVVGLTPREAMEHNPPYLVRDRYVDIPLDDQSTRSLLAMPVDRKTGDWKEGQLGELMSAGPTIVTAIAAILEHAPGRVGIGYAVNVKHATALNAEARRCGIRSAVVHGKTSKAARKEAFESLATGRLQWLFNCGIAIKGIDIPLVSAILVSRPTKSSNLWFQCDGRGLRLDPDSGKTDCIILDQGANVARHGRACDYGPYELVKGRPAGKQQEPGADPPEPWVCLRCQRSNPPSQNACMGCGERRPQDGGTSYAIEHPTDDGYVSPIGAKLRNVPAKIQWVSDNASSRFFIALIRHQANKQWYDVTGILGSSQMPVKRNDWILLSGKIKAHNPAGKFRESSQIVSVEIAPDTTFLEQK